MADCKWCAIIKQANPHLMCKLCWRKHYVNKKG